MAWKDFVKALKRGERKKKDPSKLFSEPLLIKFNPIQKEFIEKKVEIYGSKANVVRRGLNILMERDIQQQQPDNKL